MVVAEVAAVQRAGAADVWVKREQSRQPRGQGGVGGGLLQVWICSDTGGVRTASTGVNCLIADQGIVYHTRFDAV